MIVCGGCQRHIDVPMAGEPGAVPSRKVKCKECGRVTTVITLIPANVENRALELAPPAPDVTNIYIPFWKGVSDG